MASVRVDAQALQSWDASLASSLWHQLEPLSRRETPMDLQGLPEGLQQIVALALDARVPAAI